MKTDNVLTVYHHPATFTARTAFAPLVERLNSPCYQHDLTWRRWQKKSWTAGHILRQWGNAWYGSSWNALVPLLDEMRILRHLPADDPCVVHFLWGEFARPKWPKLYRSRGAKIVGTFHCSSRRQASVMARSRTFEEFDWITVVSASQIPFFVERGFPEDRIRVTLLGVDTDFFSPDDRERTVDGPLQCLLVGKTERDHEFAAQCARAMSPETMVLRVCVAPDYHYAYRGIANIHILPRLSDQELVEEYRRADLLLEPMLDCTANDAVLEAMGCGTPVLSNRVGGIPEYVNPECNYILDAKNVDDWVSLLESIAKNRMEIHGRRSLVRTWAETFGWDECIKPFLELYHDITD